MMEFLITLRSALLQNQKEDHFATEYKYLKERLESGSEACFSEGISLYINHEVFSQYIYSPSTAVIGTDMLIWQVFEKSKNC